MHTIITCLLGMSKCQMFNFRKIKTGVMCILTMCILNIYIIFVINTS